MAADSDGKLTKFESTVTVVTADFANSIFGGLYGSGEASSMDPDDPRIRGHVHDGENIDGHAPLINLVEHVEDKLLHENLADEAVHVNNVYCSPYQGEAIPEYQGVSHDSATCYYLDLRGIRADLVFVEEDFDGFAPEYTAHSGIVEPPLVRQRSRYWDGSAYVDITGPWDDGTGLDFVFGSSSLEDINAPASVDTDGDNRFLFDKSKGAFRAGGATETQWDEANRGQYSIAFGLNSEADSDHSVVSGGYSNKATNAFSAVGGGDRNEAQGMQSVVSGGGQNSASATLSTVSGGQLNIATGQHSTISGGQDHQASASYATVSGGFNNLSSGIGSVVSGGSNNEALIGSDYSNISGGQGHQIGNALNSSIGGGHSGLIGTGASYSNISGGHSNGIQSNSLYSNISGGSSNQIVASSGYATIGGGLSNEVTGNYTTIGGGHDNTINGEYAAILGGTSNTAAAQSVVVGGNQNTAHSPSSAVVGGAVNSILPDSPFSFIGAGQNNQIGNHSPFSVMGGGGGMFGGEQNSIAIPFMFGTDRIPGTILWDPGSWTLTGQGPSPQSGIFGGSGNYIAGGSVDASGVPMGGSNFIFGGTHNKIAPLTTAISYNQYILGGAENVIAGVAIGRFDHNAIGFGSYNLIWGEEAPVDNSVILSGTANEVKQKTATGQIITHSSVLGGWRNSFGNSFQGYDRGCALSTIAGGAGNEINSKSLTFSAPFSLSTIQVDNNTSCFSSILGGFYNRIDGSRGSVICGGGTIIDPSTYIPSGDTLADVWFDPITGNPVGLVPSSALEDLNPHSLNPGMGYVGNQISDCHYAGILSGHNNVIEANDGHGTFSSIVGGANNHVDGAFASSILYGAKNTIKPSPIDNTVSMFSSAGGLQSSSYNYGQKSQAAGTWDLTDGHFDMNGYVDSSGNPHPGLHASAQGVSDPGGAQTFVFTMFGHWNYDHTSYVAADSSYNCYLDGGLAKLDTERKFEPKDGSSYTFKIHGVINCTNLAGTIKHSTHFTYDGGINVDHGGGMSYGSTGVQQVFSTGPTIGGIGGEFKFMFTPLSVPATTAIGVGKEGFAGHVTNTAIDTSVVPDYWLSSCVCRVEITENNLWMQLT